MRAKPPVAQTGWAYFLDLDGTLVDIVGNPDAVHADTDLLHLIGTLHQQCNGALALVSGRALGNLQQRLDGMSIPMAGQHGLERRDAEGRLHLASQTRPSTVMSTIEKRLTPMINRHAGLRLENKGMSVALHYRNAAHLAGYVHRTLRDVLQEIGNGFQLQKGKRVLELVPIGVDKGKAIDAYLAEAPFHGKKPVFIGDDLSDEDGFATVNRRGGISIKVGEGPTCARYGLHDVAAVRNWLTHMKGD